MIAIGVDGGGTSIRAVLVDAEGRELGRAEGPGEVVGLAGTRVAGAVADAIRRAAEQAKVELPAGALWAGLAGAGSGAAATAVAAELGRRGLARHVHVGTDVEAAFHGAFGDEPGVLLVVGTGSIAWARSERGDVVRVGGWGERLGDEGSGYAIGLEALRHVARAEDGREEATRLRDAVLERLGLAAPRDLVPWAAGAPKRTIAGLAPLVVREAGRGDAAAAAVVGGAVDAIEGHLIAILAKTAPWSAPPLVALWGGLVQADGPLAGRVAARLRRYDVHLADVRIDPALAAARLALAGGPKRQ